MFSKEQVYTLAFTKNGQGFAIENNSFRKILILLIITGGIILNIWLAVHWLLEPIGSGANSDPAGVEEEVHPPPIQCAIHDDCPVNSVCQQGHCKCSAGYDFSGNMTTCLKVATSYGDTCEEHHQCSSYLSAGGTCINGKCQCAEGFHYVHGYCYRTAGLGETCLSSDHCYVNSEWSAATCYNNKCRCSDNYYQREYRSCRREGKKIGDDCAIDLDCKFSNSTCNRINGCQSEISEASVQEWTTHSLPPRKLKLKANAALIGKLCNATADCSSMGAAVCSELGTCICDRGHFLPATKNKCTAELGEPCTAGESSGITNAVCHNGVWTCRLTYVALDGNRECRKITTKYNNSCQFDEQCSIFGPDAVCTDRKCICNEHSHFAEEELYCWTSRGLGEICRTTQDCHIAGHHVGLICHENACSCPGGTHINADGSVCIHNRNVLGGFCTEDGDCSINQSVCSNRVCVCAPNHYEFNGECLRGLCADCTDDYQCSVNYSSCKNSTCSCNDGYAKQAVDRCVKVSSHGDTCEYQIQCSARHQNSICQSPSSKTEQFELLDGRVENGTCACAEGFHYNFGNCFKRRVLAEECHSIGECYSESGMNSVLCKNGICTCNFEWRPINATYCASGATAVIYNSAWLLLIALTMLCT